MRRRKIIAIISFTLSLSLFVAGFANAVETAKTEPQLPDYSQQLKEVIQLVDGGAPGLALHMMDRMQPEILSQVPVWIEWETQRLKIYQDNQLWQGLINRVSKHPETLPLEFKRQAQTQRVDAYLRLNQGKQARLELRRLILSASGEEEPSSLNWLQQWRRTMIHSYIDEGINEDALTSIIRFQQDYAVDDKALLFLHARILLLNKRPAEAAELLVKHTSQPEAGMLYLLAQLRSEERNPVKVVQAGLRHLRSQTNKAFHSSLWAIVAEAAMRTGDRGTVVNAVEHVVADSRLLSNKLFDINADNLWNAYLDYALSEGNDAQLLIGQDRAWFKYAAKSAKKFPVRQRAIYALLMHRATEESDRVKAAKLFIQSIHKRSNNSYLIQQLFSHSKFYLSLTDVPEPVRRAMIDIALARQDIPHASQIMATLDESAKGKKGFMSRLRRARILILGGEPDQGAKELTGIIQDHPKIKAQQRDRLMQVIFDLQTVGEHDIAYKLFKAVIESSKNKQLQREMYYWMADSRNAQSKYEEAAGLYLKSAMLLDGKGWDPWGQTARYQAAKALGKAKLFEDANYIYQQLLKVTKEQDRRAMLRYEVQKLQLAKSGDREPEQEAEAVQGTAK